MGLVHVGIDTYKKQSILGPSRIARNLKRMGSESVFVGKLSSDRFGRRITRSLQNEGIYFKLPVCSKKTPVAFIVDSSNPEGVMFYRDDTADLELSVEDLMDLHFKNHDILYINSFGLVPNSLSQSTHFHIIHKCHLGGGLVIFDVNYYQQLWEQELYASEMILRAIHLADMVRLTQEEALWLTGCRNLSKALQKLQTRNQIIQCYRGDGYLEVLHADGSFSCHGVKASNFYSNKEGYAYFTAALIHKLDNHFKCNEILESNVLKDFINQSLTEHDTAFTIL